MKYPRKKRKRDKTKRDAKLLDERNEATLMDRLQLIVDKGLDGFPNFYSPEKVRDLVSDKPVTMDQSKEGSGK